MKKLFYKIFKRYKRLELIFVSYDEADNLMRQPIAHPNDEWHFAKEEDTNKILGMVYLERKERITG